MFRFPIIERIRKKVRTQEEGTRSIIIYCKTSEEARRLITLLDNVIKGTVELTYVLEEPYDPTGVFIEYKPKV